jgi:hypothetical protein
MPANRFHAFRAWLKNANQPAALARNVSQNVLARQRKRHKNRMAFTIGNAIPLRTETNDA